MKLSILTPSVPTRLHHAGKLASIIAAQCRDTDEVEHLILTDNRKRTIGAKRQALVEIARGDYFAFVDDDDQIRGDYVAKILDAIRHRPDVITFNQHAVYNGQESTVNFRLAQGDQPFRPNGVTKRDAWHICAWRRELVAGCEFGESNYGEDLVWCRQARRRATREIHIPEILHEYHHSAETTTAPEPVG